MAERWRVLPQTRTQVAAYGVVWPGDGAVVTADEVGADTLRSLDADRRFVVERMAAPDASPRPTDPKPSPRRRRG